MRQNFRYGLTALVLLAVAIAGFIFWNNETKYSRKINALIQKGDKGKTEQERFEAGREFGEYVDSLSPQQLLIAGSQYAKWADKNSPPESWDEIEGPFGNLCILLLFYSEKVGAGGLTPIIKTIRNKNENENARWREVIIGCTHSGVLDDRLLRTREWELVQLFDTIVKDEKDAPRVRGMACRRLYEILDMEYDRILFDDPAVEEFCEEKFPGKVPTKDIVYESLGKEVNLHPHTLRELKPVQETASEHIEFLLTITKDPKLDPFLKDSAVYALQWYGCTPLSKGKQGEIAIRLKQLEKSDPDLFNTSDK